MKKYQNFLSENVPFLIVKFSIYLNRRVSVMCLRSVPLNNYMYLTSEVTDQSAYSLCDRLLR